VIGTADVARSAVAAQGAIEAPDPLIRIEDLHVHFDSDEGLVEAVRGVDLAIRAGETLGLVGESGSGKSVTAQAIMRLVPEPPGRIAAYEWGACPAWVLSTASGGRSPGCRW
jgi:ABC-type bacteriocin/lantibiotic exporter with double-glycine peptidase domain